MTQLTRIFKVGDKVEVTSPLLIDALGLIAPEGEVIECNTGKDEPPLLNMTDYTVLCSTVRGPKAYGFNGNELALKPNP